MGEKIATPYFLVDEERIVHNLEILKSVSDETGCRILLAQKAFSMYACYPLLSRYLSGTTASGLFEARLGAEEFGGETHVYSPAYRQEEFEEILKYADHIIFNSCSQLQKYGPRARNRGKEVGLRINPQCSTQEGHGIYDPCSTGSRLGTILEEFDEELLPLIDGLHFHTLCEQDSDDLEITVRAVEEKFGKYLKRMKWVNLGGGHHITKEGYDIQRLKRVIRHLQNTYEVDVYLEPGEAVVLNAGELVTSVVGIVNNGMEIAILDTSAACHMPDVLEMPYRPPLKGSGLPGEKRFTYRLGGLTCLAGDVIGNYSFDQPLEEGDILVFQDMALYTMVKTNTFNGMNLPSIVCRRIDKSMEIVRSFSYEDFKGRLS
ncbi:MAG: carboxynorspermidine decarboxylase [Lachnospiraceae bacterium]|nr:carboxynorspermidine decarboxylase [Lachnospiraceae bacterium]